MAFGLSEEKIHFLLHFPEKMEAASIFLNKILEVEVVQMVHYRLSCVFDMASFEDCELKKNALVLWLDLQSHFAGQLKAEN